MKRALTFLVLTGVLLTLLPINLQSKEKEILARLDQLVETLERMERKGDVQSAEVSQIYAKLKVVLSNLETLQKKQIEQEQANESVLKQLQNLKERIDELTKSVNNIYQSPNTQVAPSSEKGSGETAAASVNGAKGAAENTAIREAGERMRITMSSGSTGRMLPSAPRTGYFSSSSRRTRRATNRASAAALSNRCSGVSSTLR